jgi:hypothetical protein
LNFEVPSQESQARHAPVANGNDCLLWPRCSRASKVAVGIIMAGQDEPREMRCWKVETGEVRNDMSVAVAMVEFMVEHGVLSIVMSDGLMSCPHQEGVDYEGEWCPDPVCAYW